MRTLGEGSLPERIYRLRLLEGLMVAFREGYAREPRVVVEDLLLLRRELPYPGAEPDWAAVASAIRGLVGRCESEAVRGRDTGVIAMVVCVANEASLRPYVPTLDELALV